MEESNMDVGPYKVYAIIGFVTGIIAISMSPLFYFGVIVSIIGIVFSIKGKKSNSKEKYAQRGLLLNIIGLILSVIVSTVVLLLFVFFVANNKKEYNCKEAYSEIKEYLVENNYEYFIDSETSVAYEAISTRYKTKVLRLKNKIVRGNTTQKLQMTIYQDNDTYDKYVVRVNDITESNGEISFWLGENATFYNTLPCRYNSLINPTCVELKSFNPTGQMLDFPTKEDYEKIVSKRVVDMIKTFSDWTNEKWGFAAEVFGFSSFRG